MESLTYLLFLACPLRMVGAFMFLFFNGGTKKGTEQGKLDLQKSMDDLQKQNEHLIKEINQLKNSR